jgi:hypothetical protein
MINSIKVNDKEMIKWILDNYNGACNEINYLLDEVNRNNFEWLREKKNDMRGSLGKYFNEKKKIPGKD